MNQPKCPSGDEWICNMRYSHTVEYYSAIKRNEVLIHVTAWKNLENFMLNEKSQTQKATYRMIPFTHETSRIDKSTETECKVVIPGGWGRGKDSGFSLNILIPLYVCVFHFLSFSF